LNRLLPAEVQRPTWDAFITRTSSSYFHRMFRMEARVFHLLSAAIEKAVGKVTFKSEYDSERTKNENRTKDATDYFGGYICGELKFALIA